MSAPTQKIKRASNPIPRSAVRFLWQSIKTPRILVWFIIMFAAECANVVAAFMFTFVARNIVELASLNQHITFDMFLPLIYDIAVILAVMTVARFISRLGWVKGRVPFEMEAKSFLYRATLGHSHTYYTTHHSGRVAEKIHQIPWYGVLIWDELILMLIPGSIVMVIATIMLASLHPYLGIFVGIWAILFISIMRVFAPFHGRRGVARATQKGISLGEIVDSIANNSVMRLFAQNEHEKQIVQNAIDAEHRATLRLVGNDRWMSLCYTIPFTILATGLATLGAYFYTHQEITLADFAFIITALLIIMQFLQWITSSFVRSFEHISAIREGLELLGGDYDVTDSPDARPLRVTQGRIDFNNVTFAYNKNGAVLDNLNLHIRAGEKIGLVGLSGAGKSTLVSLLLRFYDAPEQDISIDGQNIYDVQQLSLRENIAVIPQDTSLFNRTLMENIRYGRANASNDEVIAAAKRAHAHDFIKDLPNGYDTLVGERGVKLSGGQRQRIAIARAILKDAPILILDEATSALDSESERLIQESLSDLMAGKTVIAIAHRLSTISHLDRIIVMQSGKISESGKHQELLDNGGEYAKLWSMQSGGFL